MQVDVVHRSGSIVLFSSRSNFLALHEVTKIRYCIVIVFIFSPVCVYSEVAVELREQRFCWLMWKCTCHCEIQQFQFVTSVILTP